MADLVMGVARGCRATCLKSFLALCWARLVDVPTSLHRTKEQVLRKAAHTMPMSGVGNCKSTTFSKSRGFMFSLMYIEKDIQEDIQKDTTSSQVARRLLIPSGRPRGRRCRETFFFLGMGKRLFDMSIPGLIEPLSWGMLGGCGGRPVKASLGAP